MDDDIELTGGADIVVGDRVYGPIALPPCVLGDTTRVTVRKPSRAGVKRKKCNVFMGHAPVCKGDGCVCRNRALVIRHALLSCKVR